MLPASRVAALALSKNLVANCSRATSVAFIHHDTNNPTFGVGDKSEQMKMSTEKMAHREEAMRNKAKHVKDNVTDTGMGEKIDEIKETIGNKVHNAKEMAKETAQQVKEAFGQTAQEAKDVLGGNDLSQKVENVKNKVGEKVHQAKEAVSEKAQQAKEYFQETTMDEKMRDAKEKAHEAKEAVSDKAQQAKDYYNQTSTDTKMRDAKSKAQQAKETVHEKAQEAKQYYNETSMSDKMQNMKDKASEKAHEMKESASSTIGEKIGEIKDKIGDKVQQAKEAVSDKVEELKMKIGAKEVKTNPNEFVPHMEVAANSYFDNIHDIDRIKARAEHLTNEQLTDLLRREMQMSQQPKDHSQKRVTTPERLNPQKHSPEMFEESKHVDYDLTFERGDAEKIQEKLGHLSEEQLQAELKKETQKRSKLTDPDPEQFVPRKDIEDNKYFDHIHDTNTMQMKTDGTLKVSLADILRGELQKRNLPEPDPDQFMAHMEVAENKYFDDIHNIDDMKIKTEHLDREMEALRKDLASVSRDQTPAEEAEEDIRRGSKGKIDPFMTEKSGGDHLRK